MGVFFIGETKQLGIHGTCGGKKQELIVIIVSCVSLEDSTFSTSIISTKASFVSSGSDVAHSGPLWFKGYAATLK